MLSRLDLRTWFGDSGLHDPRVWAAGRPLPAEVAMYVSDGRNIDPEVMPFDLTKTVHVFRMTDDGGTQRVVFRGDSPQPEQVRKIQHHLAMEAAAFQKGNFGDPVHLHGPNMPGLRELQAGAPRIQITYRALSNGAEIQFRTQDIELITAVHRWFGAQLSEHGPDARAE
jgi:hypothetical protein